jgi:carboxyl-terminal processing protease
MKIMPFLLLALLLTGCEKLLIESDPVNDPLNNFDIFWKTFDSHYYSFDMKGVNWDSVYAVYRPLATAHTSAKELYTVLFKMSSLLKDSHVDIYQPYGPSGYDQTVGYPENSPNNAFKYIENRKTLTKFEYGKIKNYNIGYIRIYDFEGDVDLFNLDNENVNFRIIDNVVIEMQGKKGIIFDVRSNEGGDDFNSLVVASRFADKKRIFEYIKYRKSENKNDYMTYTRYIKPKGSLFNKPIIVLTNRKTASAAESFVQIMKQFPNVTIVGGITSGAAGGPSFFELPNGWTYRLTTHMEYDPDWNCYAGIGISPNINVTISDTEAANGVDTILEKAIENLK